MKIRARWTWAIATTTIAALLSAAQLVPASAADLDPLAGAPAVGDCRDYGPKELYSPHEDSTAVDCAGGHTGLVVGVSILPDKFDLTGSPNAQLLAYASRTCKPLWQKTIGANHAQQHLVIYRGAVFFPTAAQVELGARWLRCDVTALGGKKKLGDLPRKTPFVTATVDRGDRICLDRQSYFVSCRTPHAWISRGLITAPKGPYSTQRQDAFALRRCGSTLQPSDRRFTWARATEYAWKRGERHIVCFGNGR